MGAPHAAIFCAAGHRYADIWCTAADQPEQHPVCPCREPQAGFTYHYGGYPQGDPNECREPGQELRLLGTDYVLRYQWRTWRDAKLGRKVRRRVLVSHFLEKWDISPLLREQGQRHQRQLRAV